MWNLLLPGINKILDLVIPDPKAAAEAKLKVMELQQSGQLKFLEATVAILTAEMNGNWLQRSWRPVLMLTFGGLIVARWLGFAAPNLTEGEYLKLWSIVEFGMGGYIVGRSVEKTAEVVSANLKKD